MATISRGAFSGRIGFIIAAAGSAVGLGNIWGFPYEVGKGGGGVFVLIYLFFCFTICLPVMLTEIAIGRKTKRNAVGAFGALGYGNWNFIGKLGIVSAVLMLSFYNVIAGWAFGYIFEMSAGHFSIAKEFSTFTSDVLSVGIYGFIFMIMTAFVVSRGVSGGIEKLSKILMPVLVMMMIGVSIYALTLPNAIEGLKFYLIPDFTKISFSTIYNAMGQGFFSLSLGMGTLITYGSYVNDRDNLVSSVTWITLADVGIATLAGLMIFPLIGFITSGNMDTVGRGPELIFVTLPEVFGTIGGSAGATVGAAFFVLLCFAALTSTVSMIEVPVAYLVDEFKLQRSWAVVVMAGLIFVLGLPSMLSNGYSAFFTEFIQYPGSLAPTKFLDFIVNLANDTFLPWGGLLMTLFAAYVWKQKNLDSELSSGAPGYEGSLLQKYMQVAISYIIPVVLLAVFVLTLLSTFFGL